MCDVKIKFTIKHLTRQLERDAPHQHSALFHLLKRFYIKTNSSQRGYNLDNITIIKKNV